MHKVSLKLFIMVFAYLLAFQPLFAAAQSATTYTAITGYGTIADVTRTAVNGESIINSADGVNAYKVRNVPVRDAQHLLALMGASNESELSDLQRGLLETYKFSQTQGFTDLGPRIPNITEKITLNLVDIAGYTDTTRFPKVKDDFWPVNSSVYRHNGNEYVLNSEIRISGTDALGMGSDTVERMKGTYAHEFGHSLDLTVAESGAYGFDGTHYVNEKIKPQASFAEGFANFIKWLFFQDSEQEYRQALRTVKIERPDGTYDEYPFAGDQLDGENVLNVEAINTLIFAKLATELPNGRTLVLDSFQKHNHRENRMSNFLQNFLKDHPMHGSIVASILDRETKGKLSVEQIRQILGSNPGVESYIANRSTVKTEVPATIAETTTPAEPAVQIINHRNGVIYKWKDADGNWQFTDQPPPANVDFTTRSRSPEPGRGREVSIESDGNNPFNIDQ